MHLLTTVELLTVMVELQKHVLLYLLFLLEAEMLSLVVWSMRVDLMQLLIVMTVKMVSLVDEGCGLLLELLDYMIRCKLISERARSTVMREKGPLHFKKKPRP